MKRLLVIATLMVFLAVGVASAQPTLQLIWSQQCDGEIRVRGLTVECWPTSQPPEPTTTATADPGATATATVTATVTITATATPTATPDPGVPLCPHDPTKWHDLYDEERGCKYLHEHGDDPNLANNIFGAPGAWYGQTGTEIGGPFAMASEMGPGHFAWKVFVKLNISPEFTEPVDSVGYIRALRVWTHITAGGPPDAPACGGLCSRFHAVSIEEEVCVRPQLGELPTTDEVCGIARWAGIGDFGNLRNTDQPDGLILLPNQGDGQDVDLGQQGKRFHVSYADLVSGLWPGANWYQKAWCAADANTQFACTNFAGIVADPWVYVDRTAAGAETGWICGDDYLGGHLQCGFNGSQRELHIAVFNVNPRAFTSTPVNFSAVVGAHGDPDPMCMTMGQTMCGYVSLENVPVTGYFRYANHGRDVQEYDTSPPGENWIQFPN